jgi:hypothetical protein
VAIGKMLTLGGMENKLPKTDQSVGRFRVARNVMPTPDMEIIPRSEVAEIPGQSSNFRYIHHYTQYDTSMLSVVSEDYGSVSAIRPHLYKDLNYVPEHLDCMGSSFLDAANYDNSQSFMSFRRNNTVYYCNPSGGAVFKYDGVEVSSCGVQQPHLSCADYNSAGTKYIRVIQHCIDFDNNEPVSEYVQYRTNTAGNTVIRVDGGATNIIPNTNVLPTTVIFASIAESPYFYGTATYAANEYTITTTDTNIAFQSQIGSYVIVNFQTTTAATTGLSEDCLGYAFKIKSLSPLKLDATDARYLSLNREWKSGTIAQAGVAAAISWGTRNVFTVWGSSTATGNYVFKGIIPSFPYSTTSRTFNVDVTTVATAAAGSDSVMFSISSNLGDWYDVNTRKLSPNAIYPYGSTAFYGMASYQGQMLIWADDLIWYSDPTLPVGNFEQLSTSSFLKVGETEFGLNCSICGTQDFFLVSRERKNYLVNGNISTGNYKVQEITEAEIGAWSNNSMVNVKDSVVMVTAIGIFQIMGGGRTVRLSDKIPKNFDRYNGYAVNSDVVFILSGTNVLNDTSDHGLSIAYDEYRELLVILQKGPNFTSNPALVLHTKTGEFYEWEGITSGTNQFSTAVGFKSGLMYIGKYTSTAATLGAKTFLEDISAALQYPATYPIKLYSTWMTAGEPSLEKELLQLKIFGRIYANGTTSSIKVVHFKDWDESTKVTNVEYFPVSNSQYSNKQRLNSDKVLAASCGVEISTASVKFEIESLEIEFNPIQQGIKR